MAQRSSALTRLASTSLQMCSPVVRATTVWGWPPPCQGIPSAQPSTTVSLVSELAGHCDLQLSSSLYASMAPYGPKAACDGSARIVLLYCQQYVSECSITVSLCHCR